MKRRIATLFLCFAVAFTMAVPAFAVEAPAPAATVDGSQNYSYFALGDSIGSGLKNLDITKLDPEVADFLAFTDGQKNINPYAVDFSFINRIARTINAVRDTSVNGAYPALRAKDVCEIMGLSASDPNDAWSKLIKSYAPELYSAENAQHYRDGLRNADVITVELGEDDIAAFVLNNQAKLTGIVETALGSAQNAPALAASFVNDLTQLLGGSLIACFHPSTAINGLKGVTADVAALEQAGANTVKMFQDIASLFNSVFKEPKAYYDRLMNYINANKKPGAIVVVGTLINPFKNLDGAKLGVDQKLVNLLSLITEPYVQYMNKYIKNKATTTTGLLKKNTTRNYYVADISSVDLNPDIDLDGNTYLLHPNDAGQQFIADAYIQALREAFLDAGKVFPTPVIEKYVVAVDVNGEGTVQIDGEDVAAKEVEIYDDVALNLLPEYGCEVLSVKVNDVVIDPAEYDPEGGVLKLENIKQDLDVEVVFGYTLDYLEELLGDVELAVKAKANPESIVATASVDGVDVEALKDMGYNVTYRFYRATKKNGTYKKLSPAKKNGKYIDTTVKNGKTYYYKAVLVVKDKDGNVVKTMLKDCSYGKAKFVLNKHAKR